MTVVHELIDGDEMVAWIQERPAYCDRGRWHAQVEVSHWKSENDPWPRYYFVLEHAKREVELYMAAKKIARAKASWVAQNYGRDLGDVDTLPNR